MLQKHKTQAKTKQSVSSSDDKTLKDAASKATQALNLLKGVDSFKSAEELGINDRQRDALIKTLELMEAGKVKHVPYCELHKRSTHNGYHFNMELWVRRGLTCGTVACLGGTAELIGGEDLWNDTPWNKHKHPLKNLFFGSIYDCGGVSGNTTDKQAAKALRGYLETGVVDWKKALK